MFRVLLRGVFPLVAWLSVTQPLHAQMAVLPGADSRITSVQEWDSIVESLRRGAWTARSLSDVFGKDTRGRTLDDDWNEFVVAREVLTQLDGLREKAAAQMATSDSAGLQETFNDASSLLATQVHAAAIVMTYWPAEVAVGYHRSILDPWLDLAPGEQKKEVGDHIAATMQSLVKTLEDGLTEADFERRIGLVNALATQRRTANEYYNQQRRALMEKLAKLPDAPQLRSRKRQSACPPAVMPLAGQAIPSLAKDNVSPSENYPPNARVADVEASVVLQVSISETGCMEFAQIIETSGVEDLDEGALLWAERAKFVPAEKDNKPAAGTMPFRFSYQITE